MTIIFTEEFLSDGNGTRYTASTADSLLDIASADLFGVVTALTPLPAQVEYFDELGDPVTSGFYSAQDTDGAELIPVDSIQLTWTGIDITDFENLSFTGAFAEDDDGTNQDWDTTSSVSVSYSIDGNSFETVLAFASELGTDGNQTNEVPRVDTDFDGVGDGAELTSTFQDFSASIAGVGTTLDIRISIVDLDAGDEDVAIDGFVIEGDPVSVTPVPPSDFTLELLHFTDQEANAATIDNIDNLSGVLNALRAEDLGNDGEVDNTLTLSSGDAIIPGLFFDASEAVFGSQGIADIQIQNELGVQAIALGNHEFDLGTALLAGLIDGSAPGGFTDSAFDGTDLQGADFEGALFPYLSANLDFSTDPNLAPLEAMGGQDTDTLENVVTSSSISDVNGEKIGIVGATVPTIRSISSPGNDLGIAPAWASGTPTDAELDALATILQSEVDQLLVDNPDLNKVVLLSHMQQISIEFSLAERLENVDIIVAGGSNTRLLDDNDRLRDGDSDQGQYPAFLTNAGGTTTAVVNTDGNYKYVGRLVIDFDADGNIIAESYDETVSGAFATDDQGVADLNAEAVIDPEVDAITDAIQAEIVATESNVFGVSDVFLNGNRSGTFGSDDPDGVRTQETNLGNLTADANLAYANDIIAAEGLGDAAVISIKNGGGIRANIGQIVVPAGGTEAQRVPNEEILDADGNVVKPEGGISQNDIATTLAFNNGLTLLDITKSEIKDFLEGAVSALPTGVSGGFPQISGLQFSFDETETAQTYDVDGNILTAGERVQNAGIFDADGNLIAEVVRDGEIVGEPAESFRVVTLNFLANAGDEILSNLSNPNRVDLIDLDADGVDDDVFSGAATFAANGSEQDALAEYLNDNFNPANGGTAFSEADTGPDSDSRIQNLTFREDTVLPDVAPPEPPQATGDLVATVVAEFEGDSGDPTDPEGASEVVAHEDGLLYVTNGANDRIDIFDIAGDTLANTIPLDVLDGYDGVQSVAVKNGIVAVAVSRAPVEETNFGVTKLVEQPGFVALFDASSLDLITTVDVGNLPDQLTFNADGTSLLVAGEGQFNEDSIDDGVALNPLGTVAIIDVTALDGTALPDAVIEDGGASVGRKKDAAILDHTSALELDSGTITFDLNLDDIKGRQTFVSKDARGYDDGGHITIWADKGTVKVRLQSDDKSYYVKGGKLEANVDQSIAVTFGATGLNLFVNGVLEDSNSYAGGLSGNTEPVVLGASQWRSFEGTANRLQSPMDGEIANFAVYDEALSDDQIAALADGDITMPEVTANILDFTQFNGFEDAARDAGIRIQEGVDFAEDVEPEYIAISPDGATAFVALQENNAIAKIDLATNEVVDVFGLGVTDYSEVRIDPLDDGNIDIRTFDNLVGFRMPDAIATTEIGGQTFVLTANEGDSRDFDEARVFDLAQDGLIDPTVQQELIDSGQLDLSNEDFGLGRLEVSSIDGDTDGDGDIDLLHTFSSRSFSIFDADGNLVFDSGSEFEEIIADLAPERFNDDDGDDGEDRSDAKGPEPEAIITGEVDGSVYAFVGLERDSGIMIYNIDDPANAFFVDYIPPLHVDNAGPDDVARHGPETIAFIPAEDSSTGNAQIAVAYEISGTTFVYDVRSVDKPIMDIQGAGHVSEFEGQTVRTTGIVTAVDFNGYYLQDPNGDGDDATSDAIFVFVGNGNASGITVGDEVQVRGTVSEFIPGGADTGNLSTTQISDFGASNSTVLSSGNALPDAVVIGAAGRTPPTEIVISEDELPVNLQDDPGVFNPETDGIDFYESLEGMRVVVDNPVAISATNRFDETWVVADDGADTTPGLNGRGGLDINADADGFGDVNPERIQLQYDAFFDLLPDGFTPLDLIVGDDLSDVTGVVSYSFGNFEVLVTEAFEVEAASSNVAEVTEIAAGDRDLTVATYNVLNVTSNFDSGDDDDADADQIAALAAQIVDNLGSPDILALQEIQDNSGVNFNAEDGVLDADETLQAIVDAIAAAGGPQYTAVSAVVDVEGETGGVPGGNIRNAFLYNEERVSAVDIQTLEVDELAAFGVTDPNAFDGTRDPLLGTFEFNGEEITLINNHFSSRFGSTLIFGGPQPFVQAGEEAREREAKTINEVVDALLTGDPEANVVVLGDLNTFDFTDELTEDLPGVGDEQVLTSLSATAEDNYTFNFQGNSQALDHIFVTEGLLDDAQVDVVHTNVDFADATSDHEPIVASFFFAVPGEIVAGTDGRDNLIGTPGDDQILGERGADQIFGLDGFDFIDAGRGRDVVFGGGGNDTILGGNGRDILFGEEGQDSINGGRGRDLIDGGADDDILTGGAAVDTFVFSGVFGDDIVTDFGGIDELIFTGISDADLAVEATDDGLLVTAMNDDIDGTVMLLGFSQTDFFA